MDAHSSGNGISQLMGGGGVWMTTERESNTVGMVVAYTVYRTSSTSSFYLPNRHALPFLSIFDFSLWDPSCILFCFARVSLVRIEESQEKSRRRRRSLRHWRSVYQDASTAVLLHLPILQVYILVNPAAVLSALLSIRQSSQEERRD